MPSNNDDNVTFEDVSLLFANFAGREGQYNREGDRNFNIRLPLDSVENLTRDGWNVKYTKEREDGDGDIRGNEPILPVSISYKNYPPNIWLVNSTGRNLLTEDMLEMLDYADIQRIDVIIRPYDWVLKSGASGRKAFVKTMFVTINEDELEQRYASVPIAAKPVSEND